jgi:formylglycine-generating enzyme required for sulfatase activity
LDHEADRAIFTALFKTLVESKDQSHYLQPMINLVRALPNDEVWADLHKLRKNTEANLAWQANAEGNLDLAKEITHRLLAEGHESAYLYFLEARLAWKETVPVGMFPPNNLGLFDLSGNVAELVADPWDSQAYQTPAQGSKPGFAAGQVIRGAFFTAPSS